MASTSETGHAKNVANFEKLISFCTSYGGDYNPSNGNLSVAALGTAFTNAGNAMDGVKQSKVTYTNAVNARQLEFKDLKPLSTRIVNALAVSGAGAGVIKDAKTINRKIQGSRASKKATPPGDPNTPVPKTISVSQLSYDQQVEHFGALTELVSQEPLYKPNEADLKTAALGTKVAALKTANTNVDNTYTDYNNKVLGRNDSLYAPVKGLVAVALDCKSYVKSAFGAASPHYKQVSGLQFKTVKS